MVRFASHVVRAFLSFCCMVSLSLYFIVGSSVVQPKIVMKSVKSIPTFVKFELVKCSSFYPVILPYGSAVT